MLSVFTFFLGLKINTVRLSVVMLIVVAPSLVNIIKEPSLLKHYFLN